ncbi:MAG: primary-amine oxidase, partial [Candidatus Tectomicrobia bacterium]|nr:primary-amine oxidase [Candidatus Tectomicrobia bacterium]
ATWHPLDPLSAAEMEAAVAIIRDHKQFGDRMRFASVNLQEPAKSSVLSFNGGDPIEREAFLIVLDNADGKTYEVVVSLTQHAVTQFKSIPGVQPAIIADEFFECEAAVKRHPDVQAALRKRGITDLDLVTVDPWSAGHYGEDVEQQYRLSRALLWTRFEAGDNNYAHPIDGLMVLVDLNAMEVVRVEDREVVPVPEEMGNYSASYIKDVRADVKPLEVVQPDGVSFDVNGWEVSWQKWRFRIGFTHREGLVLHQVSYEEDGRVRPILYRASVAEMTVPYGDPSLTQCRKNAFDIGEYGVGMLANSLELGCDCLGEIYYFDAHVAAGTGDIMTIKNAVCLHEEDFSILWKHVDFRTQAVEVRRSRRLVVSFIATVGNYEYGFYWYFYQDGTVELDIKMTGILSTAATHADTPSAYGTMLAPGLYAPNHQHAFCTRLDMAVDGLNNTVEEVNTVAAPMGPDNPYGNAFRATYTALETEKAAQRRIDPFAARYWQITNRSSHNKMGSPVAYKLLPGANTVPFAHPESSIAQRGGYMWQHLWVTPYHPDECYPAGNYPNQSRGGDGLPAWTQADRAVADTDVVVWYVMTTNHIARLEDWPVMPVENIGFKLKPSGFFDRNPALDVPPSNGAHCH